MYGRFRHFSAGLLAAGLAALAFAAPPGAAAPGAVLAVDGRSNATPWVAALGSHVAVAWGATADSRTDVFVALSRDGGGTFGAPLRVNAVAGEARLGGELPPRVALSHRPGAPDPVLTVLWTARGDATAIKMTRSRNGGRTFEAPTALQASGAPGDRGWPSLAIDSAGAAHAIWLDHRGLAAGAAAGGAAHHREHSTADGAAMAQKSGLFYAGSAGAAERGLTNGVCYCCKTAMAAGPGGRLFAAWRHVYAGNVRDIAFAASRDGGRTFTAPVRVSDDKWVIAGCPDDGPAMAADADGTVHLAWPTVLGGDTPQGALFYATTRDGRRFTPRVRIPTMGSPKPAHPQIALDGSGGVVVAWDEIVDGRRSPFARTLRRAADGAVQFGEPVALDGGSPGAYPVLARTATHVIGVWTAGAGTASAIKVGRWRVGELGVPAAAGGAAAR